MSSSGSVFLISARTSSITSSTERLRLAFSLTVKSPRVGFGHSRVAELQAGAARRAFDLGHGVQNALHVLEHAVGLCQRTARGHEVVEDKAAFVHLREQIGTQRLVAETRAHDQQQADAAHPQRLGQCPVQHLADALSSTRVISLPVP